MQQLISTMGYCWVQTHVCACACACTCTYKYMQVRSTCIYMYMLLYFFVAAIDYKNIQKFPDFAVYRIQKKTLYMNVYVVRCSLPGTMLVNGRQKEPMKSSWLTSLSITLNRTSARSGLRMMNWNTSFHTGLNPGNETYTMKQGCGCVPVLLN